MKNHSILFALCVVLNTTYSSFAATIYVKHDAIGINNGTSWVHAYTDLQNAMNAAAVGDQIWVATGTYKPTQYPTGVVSTDARNRAFFLDKDVKIYGGFTETMRELEKRDPIANPTILSGDFNGDDSGTTNTDENAYHVFITVNLTENALLDGFTIQSGSAKGKLQVAFSGQAFVQTNGGGMYNVKSALTVRAVRFIRNQAAINGGGMFNQTSSPILVNLEFLENRSAANGGGIANAIHAAPQLVNAVFSDNHAKANGGGIFNDYYCAPMVVNTSFSGNGAAAGGAIYNGHTSESEIANTIIWDNAGGEVYSDSMSKMVFYHCILKGSGGSDNWNTAYGINSGANLDTDPLFVDVAARNFVLMVASPAIDAGNNAFNNTTTDLAGNYRIQNQMIDIGPFETIATTTTSTAVPHIEKDASPSCSLMPNPAHAELTVSLQNIVRQDVRISAFSATGQLVHTYIATDVITRINTANWTNGLYFLNIQAGTYTASQKVVIQH